MSAKMGRSYDTVWQCITLMSIIAVLTEAKEYCGRLHGREYYCDTGHCCGRFECCTYYKYYEMWWFWLVWGLISLLGCCCAYHRRRYYGHHAQIQNFVYPTVLRGGMPSSSQEELVAEAKYKLPSYAEVEAMGSLGPPDDGLEAPPPYLDHQGSVETQGDTTVGYFNQGISSDDVIADNSCHVMASEEALRAERGTTQVAGTVP